MEKFLDNFKSIAPYLRNPLVLIGLVFALVVYFVTTVYTTETLSLVGQDTAETLLKDISFYLLTIAWAIILLGCILEGINAWRKRKEELDSQAILDRLESKYRQHLEQSKMEADEWRRQAKEAVNALNNLRRTSNQPVAIEEAIEALRGGETQRARFIFQQIATSAEEEVEQAAEAYRHLGAMAMWDDTNEALNAFARATELAPNNQQAWNSLGILLLRLGRIEEARDAFLKFERIAKKNEDKDARAIAFSNLAGVEVERENWDQAEAFLRKAFVLSEEADSEEGRSIIKRNKCALYETKAQIALRRGLHEDAERALRESIMAHLELGWKEEAADDYRELAQIYKEQNRWGEVAFMCRVARHFYGEVGLREKEARAAGNMGVAYTVCDQLDVAEEAIEAALEIHKELGNETDIADNYTNLAMVAYRRGEEQRARELMWEAIKIREKNGVKRSTAIEYEWLASSYRDSGDLKRANELEQKAAKVRQEADA